MSLVIAGNSAGGYNLTKSLRLRSSASAYLNRTFGSGNAQKFTASFWWKSNGTGGFSQLISAYNNSTNISTTIRYQSDGSLSMYSYNLGTSSFEWQVATTAVYRDPASWYHVVYAVDTTQATASDRVKLYINGVQVTAFSTTSYPSLNYNTTFNVSGKTGYIGTAWSGSSVTQFVDGYLAEFNYVDGQQLTASSFGSTNTTTGVWQPARYTGTYGTNGFYLPFTNTTSTTTLGYDFSGNSNNWTTNNISLTAGTTYDSMNDVPTLTSATVANYCVNNAVNTGAVSGWTCSDGNLKFSPTTLNNWCYCLGTFGMSSGKWYWEGTMTLAGEAMFGITASTNYPIFNTPGGWNTSSYTYYVNGQKFTNTTGSAYGASWTNGDIIGVAFDADARTLTFYKNGVSQGVAFSSIPAGTYSAQNACTTNGVSGNAVAMNYGQQPFVYTPPTGHLALNSYNLPDSTILAGNKVMDATTYTGNGSTQSIVNTGGFKPDAVWVKGRNTTFSHMLSDSVRGVTNALYPNLTNAETTGDFTAFNSNGFSVNSGATVNQNAATYVGWQWQAGQGTNTTNTSGSITSTVSVNPTAGFSIVTYTGTGASGTVGHGLGVTPTFIVYKSRSNAQNWLVNIGALTGTQGDYVYLNSTQQKLNSANVLNANSSTFPVATSPENNQSGITFVAYCWAPIAGFSQFGSFSGNGTTDNAFIYTGFRPKFLLMKRTDTADKWIIWDSVRNTYNYENLELYPNSTDAEASAGAINSLDFLSNGIKIRNQGVSGTWIYVAFAENPFKNALARQENKHVCNRPKRTNRPTHRTGNSL